MKMNDITGQKFGRLTAIKRDITKKSSSTYWVCQCDCGKITSTRLSRLTSGITQSCGCYNKERIKQANTKDLTGQRFGYLIALEINKELTDNKFGVHWKCKCDCGNYTNVLSNNLVKGNTISCGCLKSSQGEENICNLLKQNNIQYIREYKFLDLNKYRFDFYLPQLNRLIEFDGIQHYQERAIFSDSLADIQKRDKIKNEYALMHNISLVRIPYWNRDNITIEMILGDMYLVKDRTEAQERWEENWRKVKLVPLVLGGEAP